MEDKKTALRMIPYGLYVITANNGDAYAASTVNWVTQTSFDPPLLVVAIKANSGTHGIVKESQKLCINILGKGQGDVAGTFFKPATVDGQTINGQPFQTGSTGVPVLDNAIASVECSVEEVIERGDHSVFIVEVKGAKVHAEVTGRPDEMTLGLAELGAKVFYGG